MAHVLDGFNSGFARPKLDALLKDFEASFRPNSPAQNESPKAPPIAFKSEPSVLKAPVLARNSPVDLQKEFDAAFNPDGTLKDPSNAKPFSFMSAAPKKKDLEMAPATAPTMSGP
jgi:hypothetical protein